MKLKNLLLLTGCIFASVNRLTFAQPQGTVVYEYVMPPASREEIETRIEKFRPQLEKLPLEMQEKIISEMRANFQTSRRFNYRLFFEGEKNIVWEATSHKQQLENSPMKINFGIVTTHIYPEKKVAISQGNIFEKSFIVSEKLPEVQWQVVDSIRNIGPFEARKAIGSVEGKKLEAWYTTEIPVSIGPNLYGGLKGLILEINLENGDTFLFKEYHAEIPQEVNFTPPSKGKEITKEEFDKLAREKLEQINQTIQEQGPIKIIGN